ncbi:MAG: polysaccharide biosynthesis transport protein [Sphingomonadales bacterium]|jgi:capsular exopolysaccharide synthesis family protein|nr:polysaccharide biosynthesis transport protein [Sphingomonadales bacterium]MEA3034967.1 polysaccharide biosynthesis transport protein [Sphingomonadales bacterium]
MSKNDIEPAGAQPIWPLAPQPGGALAIPAEWGPQPASAGFLGADFNLATLWRIVSEWRWLILGAVAVGLAGAIVITFLTTPLYRATVLLEINPPTIEAVDESKVEKQTVNERDYLATQVGLLTSRSLAQHVAEDLNLASNPQFVPMQQPRDTRVKIATGRLQGGFEAKTIEGSRLIRLNYVSPSPDLAARIVNSFADNFINSNLERRIEATAYARRFLEKQIAKVKGELEISERQLVQYAQQQNILNLGGGDTSKPAGDANSLQGASLMALNQALTDAQSRRISAEEAYRSEARAGTTEEVNASTQALRTQRAQLESEYQQKLSQFKPDYPEMLQRRAQIDALDKQITLAASTVRGGRANTLLAQFRAAAAAERVLQGKVESLKRAVLDLRERSIKYNILQRDVDTNRTMYNGLLERYKQIGVAGGVGTNTVSIVDNADTPSAPYKPNVMLNLLIGLGLGLVGGIAAALALEFLNDTIKTPDDVRDKLHLPSLGIIPKKKGAEAFAEELKDQASPISEAYFSLRTSLQFTTDSGAPKSLLITSTRAAEGKSSTTLALAQNFARIGNSVLLIDGDLRKPAFVTGLDADEGLSKLLTNHEPLEKHVLKTQFDNLSLLPCGPLPPNPAELLASPRLKAILADAVGKFDMVIVDGPPVLGLADAPLLSGVCRATLLVVESGRTRTKAALDAIRRLKASGGNLVGAVLTKFRAQSHGYGYGYGYGYEPYRYGGVGSRDREIKLIAQREE